MTARADARTTWWQRARPILFKELGWFGIPRRESARQIIDAVPLPADLRDKVRRIVKRTRLRRGEKRDVARELCAHFADGLESGATAESLAKDFGDEKAAANLIRRAKKRNRGFLWKSFVGLRRAVGVTLAVFVGLYVVFAVRLAMSERVISRDYLAEFNAPALAVPVEERGWTILQTAGVLDTTKLEWRPGESDAVWLADASPGDPAWEQANQVVEECESALEAIRRAANAPKMAFVMSPAEGSCDPKISGSMIRVLLPALGEFRRAAQLLQLDATVAAANGDGARVMSDIEAVRGLAKGVAEPPLLICSLVSLAIDSLADGIIGDVLQRFPESLTNEQLQELAHNSAGRDPETLFVRAMAGERALFGDTIQRVYTDNGDGNGLLDTRAMAILLRPLENDDGGPATEGIVERNLNHPVEAEWRWISPVGAMVFPDRAEMTAVADQLFDSVVGVMHKPMWQWSDQVIDAKLDQFIGNPIDRVRFKLIVEFLPTLGRCPHLKEQVLQTKTGTEVAIALELFRRDHRRWPKRLDELSPKYLPTLPLDRFTGTALQYSVRDDQPWLYSVGVDRDDDGGKNPRGPWWNRSVVWNWKPLSEIQKMKAFGSRDFPDGDWILWPPQQD